MKNNLFRSEMVFSLAQVYVLRTTLCKSKDSWQRNAKTNPPPCLLRSSRPRLMNLVTRAFPSLLLWGGEKRDADHTIIFKLFSSLFYSPLPLGWEKVKRWDFSRVTNDRLTYLSRPTDGRIWGCNNLAHIGMGLLLGGGAYVCLCHRYT